MASAQVVETSVANNSPSKDSSHPDDHFQSRDSSIDHARLINLPYVNIISCISNLPNLNEVDVDLNFPTHINSKYYTPHELHSSPDICNLSDKSLSFLHCNIRSLSANFQNLQHMLSNLNHTVYDGARNDFTTT